MEKYEEALRCFDIALEIDPNFTGALGNKGYTLNELKKYEEAIKCFDRALEIDPKDFKSCHNKGRALWKLGKTEEADIFYNRALEMASEIYTRGAALEELKKVEDKILEFSSIELSPATDEIPEARGRFGYDITNPVPVKLVHGEIEYLSGLKCDCGALFQFNRKGSFGMTVDGHIIDGYKLVCLTGKHRITLYMDMYHEGPSRLLPEGLSR